MRVARRGALALALPLLVAALGASSALAAPVFDLELERTTTPLTHSDERAVYEVTVRNAASTNPVVGDEMTCNLEQWFSATEFEIEWLRNGVAIPGTKGPAASSDTYVLTAEDAGEAIQCVVTGINPEAKVQLAEGVVAGTAGSNVLTVRSKIGTGTLTAGSNVVTSVSMFEGPYGPAFLVGQTITGPGIPAETTIAAVNPGAETLELSKAATASGSEVVIEAGAAPFAVGQLVFGTNFIPQGAEITAVSGQQVTISGNAAVTFGSEYLYSTAKPPTLTPAKILVASQPPVVVAPVPPLAPPTPSAGAGMPSISPSFGGEDKRTCDATAMNLSGSPTYAYQWLRDGVPIPSATTSEYTPGPEDVGSTLQCRVTASNAGGAMVGISFRVPDRVGNAPTGSAPAVEFSNSLFGPVTVEMELPGGVETYALQVTGNKWSCAKQQPSEGQSATATCTRSDSLSPGQAYPEIELVERPGADAPDTLITKVTASGGGAPDPASAEDSFSVGPALPFGFKAFQTGVEDPEGNEYTQAGGHPQSVSAHLALNEHTAASPSATGMGFRASNGFVRTVNTDPPPGFIGNPEAMPETCPSIADVVEIPSTCPAESAVGGITVTTSLGPFIEVPIYSIEPEHGSPAEFGFGIADGGGQTFALVPELRPEDGYAIRLLTAPVSKTPELFEATVTLCGFGAKLGLKEGTELAVTAFKGCRKAGDPGATERPFLTLPTKCGDPASATTDIFADSWEDPGKYAKATHTLTTPEGCEELQFEPEIKARPTTTNADSPTGLDFNLHIPQNEDVEGTATSHLKKAVVTLPEGLVVNPSGANGLGACAEAQVGMSNGVPDNEPVKCPDASKIGSVSVTTPILDHPLPGALYVAMPHENPFDSLLALYLVVESPDDGLTIKLAGKVEANPSNGRLTTSFDQNPQAPVEDVELKVRGGASAPLRTPTACGKYTTTASLTPWSAPQSGPPATPKDSWQVNRGPGGGACLSTPPNIPSFEAGSASPIAGAHSPFVVKLSRADGAQQFSQVTVTPPPGLLAKLAGTSQCSEASLAQAKTKSGKQEQSSPSCPASSELGSVIAAAGAGPAPFQAQGKAYLAGPYKGAPLSLAIITPAVAGPFDLGVVVVRAAAYVNPATAQITVRSDPLPTILEGIPLDIRSATVSVDRPNFTLNPTSCDPMAVKGELLSTLNQSAALESRFQVAECGRLPFKPKLALKLKGKTKRGDYQGLSATLTAKPGEANIASASVTLPRSAFLAQEHIRTVCTRVQFAADACPKGSIYGKAKAVTPLLDEPLEGPVYLRSSNNKLPDLVVALKGPDSLPVEVELAGRTDSRKGALRNTFDLVPDAPVSKFTLELFGGKKGLVVNSRDLCGGTQRASVEMTAQNGKGRSFRPLVQNGCTAKARKGKGKGRGGGQ